MAKITKAKNYLRYLMAFLVVGIFSMVGRSAPTWAQEAKAEHSANVFQEEFRMAQGPTNSQKANLWESIYDIKIREFTPIGKDSDKDSRLEFNDPKGWVDSPQRNTDKPAVDNSGVIYAPNPGVDRTNRSYDTDQVINNDNLDKAGRIIGAGTDRQTDSRQFSFTNTVEGGRSISTNIEAVQQLRGFIDTDLKEIEAKLSAGQELSLEETRFIISIENARKIDQVFTELQELKAQNKALLQILNSERTVR